MPRHFTSIEAATVPCAGVTAWSALLSRGELMPGEHVLIQGTGGEPLEGGATINSALDHRIAMSFAVAGQHCYHPVTVDDVSPIATSLPTFEAMMHNLQVAH